MTVHVDVNGFQLFPRNIGMHDGVVIHFDPSSPTIFPRNKPFFLLLIDQLWLRQAKVFLPGLFFLLRVFLRLFFVNDTHPKTLLVFDALAVELGSALNSALHFGSLCAMGAIFMVPSLGLALRRFNKSDNCFGSPGPVPPVSLFRLKLTNEIRKSPGSSVRSKYWFSTSVKNFTDRVPFKGILAAGLFSVL